MASEKKTITVFGSSKPIAGDEEYDTAYKLGSLLAENGFNVCSGGFMGIMEAVSKGASEYGGEVIGVTISPWVSKPNKYLTREIKCKTLFERIQKLIDVGDAYVVLQGGTGTLLELAAVWEFSNKGLMDHKPIFCHSELWKEITFIMNRQMAYESRSTELVKAYDSVEEIVTLIKKLI